MRMGSVESAVAENLEGVMRDGPRLHYGLRSAIACRGNGKVLKVGLGAMGVGQMVFSDEGYADKPEFAEAPEVDDPENYLYDVLGGRGLVRKEGK